MELIGNAIGWIVFGLIVGILARLLHPGRDEMGLLATTTLGIVGSLLGGGLWYLIQGGVGPFSPGGFFLALIGAILLLAVGLFANEAKTAKARR